MTYIPNPANYTMKGNAAPKEVRGDSITQETIDSIEQMDREALISLVQRVGGAIWGVALKTNEQRREAMKLRIAHIALTAQDNHTILKACNDWLDREEGKAVQRIDQRVLHAHKGRVGEMTNEELMTQLQGVKQLPSGITLLENGMIDVTNYEEEKI